METHQKTGGGGCEFFYQGLFQVTKASSSWMMVRKSLLIGYWLVEITIWKYHLKLVVWSFRYIYICMHMHIYLRAYTYTYTWVTPSDKSSPPGKPLFEAPKGRSWADFDKVRNGEFFSGFWYEPRNKAGVSYFPLNPGCLRTGSLLHGLWHNLHIIV